MACSSAIRAATVSASLPISAVQFCPSAGRQWGSQRTHCQAARPSAPVSTQTWTSSGLCSTATWATSHRPMARDTSPGPATPATDRSARGIVTGASEIRQHQRAAVRVGGRVGQFHGGWQVGGADAEQQVVRIGAAAFPQPPARARRDRQNRGGVRAVVPPPGPLGVQGLPGVAFDPGPAFLVVGLLAGMGLAAVPPVADVTAQQHHRAEHGQRQHVHLAQEVRHAHAEQHGDQRHQDRHRPPLGLARRVRQLEAGGRFWRQ